MSQFQRQHCRVDVIHGVCLKFTPERRQRHCCSDVLRDLISQSYSFKYEAVAKVLFYLCTEDKNCGILQVILLAGTMVHAGSFLWGTLKFGLWNLICSPCLL